MNKIKITNSKWIAKKCIKRIKAEPKMKLTTMKEAIKIEYNVDFNTMVCYRARDITNIHVQGSIAE